MLVYGYLTLLGANMIGDGGEHLLSSSLNLAPSIVRGPPRQTTPVARRPSPVPSQTCRQCTAAGCCPSRPPAGRAMQRCRARYLSPCSRPSPSDRKRRRCCVLEGGGPGPASTSRPPRVCCAAAARAGGRSGSARDRRAARQHHHPHRWPARQPFRGQGAGVHRHGHAGRFHRDAAHDCVWRLHHRGWVPRTHAACVGSTGGRNDAAVGSEVVGRVREPWRRPVPRFDGGGRRRRRRCAVALCITMQ